MIDRRCFLRRAGTVVLGSAAWAQAPKPRRILVASQWHNVNIGDIAHGPGLVRLIERHLPGVEVSLWPARAPTDEIRAMMMRAFPRLAIVEGTVAPDGKPSTPEFAAEIARCNLMILASGGYHPFPVEGWRQLTRNPYGVFGNGFDHLPALTPAYAEQLNSAQFVYGRETASAGNLKRLGVTAPDSRSVPTPRSGSISGTKHAPPAISPAPASSRASSSASSRCCGYAPHWKIYGKPPSAADLRGEETNEKFKAQDHAAARELITTWVRTTGLKVLACPEMTYEVDLAKEQLVDPLPDDVKRNVVRRESFWMPDEASSVYAQAVAVISLKCHSPILALANGTPAIHVRLPTETRKGQMFADVGVGEWLHEVEQLTGERLAQQVLDIHANSPAARGKVRTAMERVNAIYRDVFSVVARALAA